MLRRICWIMAVLVMAMPAPGLTAEAEQKNETVVLDDIVVTATKTKEAKKDVSNHLVIKDGPDIEMSPALGIGDLLGGETGIDWRTRGDFGGAAQELHIRGMGGDGTQVMVNGMTVNSPSLGTANVAKIPVNRIQRIEVVKGAGSVLYGSGAMGGIVNIITKGPDKGKTDLGVSAEYGTEATWHIYAENGMFVTDHFGYYITANRFETDGFRDNADAGNKDASLNLVYETDDRFSIRLYGDIIDRENGNPGPVPPDGTSAFSVNGIPVYNTESASLLNRDSEEDKHLLATVKAAPSDWLGIHIQADYTDMESENLNRRYSGMTPGNLPGTHTMVSNEILGLEGNVELALLDNFSFLLGAQHKAYEWEHISDTLDGFGHLASTLTGRNNLHSTGFYAETHYRPSRYVKGTLGVRHEDHSEFGGETLPRAGLVVNPTDTTTIRFNSGKHFKAPTPNDLFWPYEDWGWGMGAEGNPSLKPETGKHSDIGIEQGLAHRKISASLTYFKWDIEDKIEWVPNASYFYRPENLSEYEADGIEAGLKIGPYYNAFVDLSYTRTDAKERKEGGVSRQARYTPDDFFKASLNYRFDFGLDVTAVYRYTGKRPGRYASDTDTAPSETLGSYHTVDLRANQRINGNWSVSCQMNNLFDEDYDTYVQDFYDSNGVRGTGTYKGAGLSVFASVKYIF